jgi:ribosomal protein S18 acetylase RimI-like enzyme
VRSMPVRAATEADRAAVDAFLEDHGSASVARLGELVDARDHPALVASADGGLLAGVLTFVVMGGRCEVLTLHATERGQGVGSALLDEVARVATAAGCRLLWLVTTNDNVDAIRFYQRRGFRLAELRPGAVDESRRTLKPEIPETGEHGIPLRDELVLQRDL